MVQGEVKVTVPVSCSIYYYYFFFLNFTPVNMETKFTLTLNGKGWSGYKVTLHKPQIKTRSNTAKEHSRAPEQPRAAAGKRARAESLGIRVLPERAGHRRCKHRSTASPRCLASSASTGTTSRARENPSLHAFEPRPLQNQHTLLQEGTSQESDLLCI